MNKANWDTANYAIKQESENFKEETWGGWILQVEMVTQRDAITGHRGRKVQSFVELPYG